MESRTRNGMALGLAELRDAYKRGLDVAEDRGDAKSVAWAKSRLADLGALERFGVRMIEPASDGSGLEPYDAAIGEKIRGIVLGRVDVPTRNPLRGENRVSVVDAERILTDRLAEIASEAGERTFAEDLMSAEDSGQALRRQLAAVEQRLILHGLNATASLRRVGRDSLEVTREQESLPLSRCWNIVAGAYSTVRSHEFILELAETRRRERGVDPEREQERDHEALVYAL